MNWKKPCGLFGLLLTLCITTLSAQDTTWQSAVNFASGDHTLTVETRKQLQDLSQILRAFGDYQVDLQAHTDSDGSLAYNEALANRRAEAVAAFLMEQGLEVNKILATAFGEKRPLASNDTEEGKAQNRRVEILLEGYMLESLDELLGMLSGHLQQEYTISGTEPVRLTARHGTTLWIEAGSFVDAEGKPAEEVTLTLQEAYAYDDMILSGLHTGSGSELLETGGMVYLDARSADGQPLELAEGAPLQVGMPTNFYQEGMQLFTGVQDEEGDLADWQATGQDFQKQRRAYLEFPPRPPYPEKVIIYPNLNLPEEGKPQPPKTPRKPIRPKEPLRQQFSYNPPFFKKLTLGKEKIKQIEQEKYQKALINYQERRQNYEEEYLPKYQARMREHRLALEKYQHDLESWKLQREEEKQRLVAAANQQQKDLFELEKKRYEEEMEVWRQKKEEILKEFEGKYAAEGYVDRYTLRQYLYQVNELGWINCDRFLDIPAEQKEALAIQGSGSGEELVYVIFKERNSILQARADGAVFRTQAIPRDQEVKILAVSVENGRPYMAFAETTVAKQSELTLEYQAANLKEVRKELQKIGRG